MEVYRILGRKRLSCGGMLLPIIAIGDPNQLIEKLSKSEEHFRNMTVEDFQIVQIGEACLDPGGMISCDSVESRVVCQGATFVTFASKVGDVIDRLYASQKRAGYTMFPASYSNVFIPTDMVDELISLLMGLSTTDEVADEEKRLKDAIAGLTEGNL